MAQTHFNVISVESNNQRELVSKTKNTCDCFAALAMGIKVGKVLLEFK